MVHQLVGGGQHTDCGLPEMSLSAANHGGLAASITVWLWYVHLV